MPDKQDRQAKHIIESEMARGKSREEAEHIAWAKVKHGKKKRWQEIAERSLART